MSTITKSANYLSDVAEELPVNHPYLAKINSAISTEAISWTRSPVELNIADVEGNVTGLVNGEVHDDIPVSTVDPETGMITILFPEQSLKYNVIGKANATYGLVLSDTQSDQTVSLIDIPTTSSSTHVVAVNWSAVASSTNDSVDIKVDNNSDGVVDSEVKTGSEVHAVDLKPIDMTPPEPAFVFSTSTMDFEITGSDASPVAVSSSTEGTSTTYTLTDSAGNTTIFSMGWGWHMSGLKYNGVLAPMATTSMRVKIVEDMSYPPVTYTYQIVTLGSTTTTFTYNDRDQQTSMETSMNGKTISTQTLPHFAQTKIAFSSGVPSLSWTEVILPPPDVEIPIDPIDPAPAPLY